jgi:hypothetical protein
MLTEAPLVMIGLSNILFHNIGSAKRKQGGALNQRPFLRQERKTSAQPEYFSV